MSKASALFPPFVLAEIQVDKLTKSWILPLAAPSYRFSQKNEAVLVEGVSYCTQGGGRGPRPQGLQPRNHPAPETKPKGDRCVEGRWEWMVTTQSERHRPPYGRRCCDNINKN